jgi:hypothetical protein
MKFKVIDRCCNEFTEVEVKMSDISHERVIELVPAKKGHSIVIHPDLTIEYMKI